MSYNSQGKVLAVIPARMASTRFPGKIIAPLAGKPLVVHTFEQTRQARAIDEVIVATDDVRVANAIAPYGVPVAMTRADHPSGIESRKSQNIRMRPSW